MLELTRAANHICLQVRKTLFHAFIISEGILLLETGPNMRFEWTTLRMEYPTANYEDLKYKGLRHLMEDRVNWNYHFGNGVSEDYFPRKIE